MIRQLTAVAAAAALLTACGSEGGPGGGPGGVDLGGGPDLDTPPPVTIHLSDRDVELKPWTWCWSNGCADGMPPEVLQDVGSPDAIEFSFPEPDWEFDATFVERGPDRCARRVSVPATPQGDGRWRLEPAGPAGDWDVELFGAGGGDIATSFAWTTPNDGTLPGPPTGSAAVLADHDGELDSYGVEVGVDDLAEQPRTASAEVTVTSAEGRSVTITPRRQRGCYSAGSLWFTASDDVGREATELGAGPFEYVVELDLDGTTYTGRGTWPDGETEDAAPHVPLTWTPALPAYTGD